MKSFSLNGFQMATAVAAALLIPMGLSAGEAIVPSTSKNHAYPSLKPNLPADASKGLNFGVGTPMDGVTPDTSLRRRDRRAERKAQNAEDEKKNWMVLDPGQLDEEDKEKSAFGVKEYDLEKPKTKRDYFFDPPKDKGSRPQHLGQKPGHPAGKNKNAQEPKEITREQEQGAKDPNSSGDDTEKEARPVGAHVSKDLDLKDLLAPGKANSLAPAEDKTAKMWKDVLGSGATGESRADADRRDGAPAADGFRPSTGGSTMATRSQEPTPSFGVRNGYASPPAASSPNPSGTASRGLTAPSTPMIPRASDRSGGAFAPPSVSRAPTPDSFSRPNGSGFGSGSANSPFNQQTPPRRPSSPSSTFDIPARPR